MEKLNKRELKKRLPPCIKLRVVKKTSSTFDLKNPGAIVALCQTNGRGRSGKSFFSPLGGIYFCLRVKDAELLTVSAAAGVARTLCAFGIDARIKWVNDILAGGKKVCGILVRAAGAGEAAVGVGLNYCVTDFPPHLRQTAASLFGTTDGINEFAAKLITSVYESLTAISPAENLEYYTGRLAVKNGDGITLPDGSAAVMEGITAQGHLAYVKDGQKGFLNSGEITIRSGG